MITRVARTDERRQMTKAWDGTPVPLYGEMMPCGGTPTFDYDSSCYSYRCDACFAVVGSIGMPQDCKEAWQAEINEKKTFAILQGTHNEA